MRLWRSLGFRGLLLAGLGGLCCGTGLLASSLQPLRAIAIVIIALGAAVIAHVRGRIRRRRQAPGASANVVPVGSFAGSERIRAQISERSDVDLRLARLLYYGGTLLIGQLTFRPIFPLTISDWLFFFAFCAAASQLVLRHTSAKVKLPSSLLAGILLFAIGGVLSSFGSDLPSQSIAVIGRLCYLTVIWFWLGTLVLRRVEHIRTAIVLWVCSAALDGLGAIAQYVKGDVIPGGQVHWGRVSGFTQNVNDLGGVTSIALVPALLLLLFVWKRSRGSLAFLRAGGVVLIATGLILSGSVGSLAAASVAVAFWFGSQPTPIRRLLALAVLAMAFLTLSSGYHPTYSQSTIDRITRFGTKSPDDPNKTLDSRVAGYRVAFARVAKNPLVGVGLDSESNRAGKLPVHNIVLGTWFATGLLGLIGMSLIFFSVARVAWRTVVDAADATERALALALVSSFLAFGVFLLSEPALFTRYGWIAAALSFSLRTVQADRVGVPSSNEVSPAPLTLIPASPA